MNGPQLSARRSGLSTSSAWLRAGGWPSMLALSLPLLAFWLHGDIGLNLQDEGFLWYGAQRVLAGEVPQRDFQSYDIGRYYWSAASMWLAGDPGVMALRAGQAALAVLCVGIAMSLVRSGRRQSGVSLALAGLCFVFWLVPHYKLADSLAPLVLVAGLAGAIAVPTARRSAIAGACLGLAGVIGINHALYGAIGALLALAYLHFWIGRRIDIRSLLAFVGGSLIGYSPVLAFHLAVPGFAEAFVDSIRLLAEAGTTNIELPFPPLTLPFDRDGAFTGVAVRDSVTGLVYLMVPIALAASVLLELRRRSAELASPVHVAALALAIPYLHYTLSRCDFEHEAVTVLPLLLAAWTLPEADGSSWRAPAVLCCTLVLVSFVMAGTRHPTWDRLYGRPPLQEATVLGDRLRVPVRLAAQLQAVQTLIDTRAPAPRAYYVAPYSPGTYALGERRSPTWEIYALFPALAHRQASEITRLGQADIGFAAIARWRVDDRPDLGFARTHADIDRHVRECMVKITPPPGSPTHLDVYVPDAGRCAAR